VGEQIDSIEFTREDRQRYRDKVKRNLAAFRAMLDADAFERERKLAGLEMEFYVVDGAARPAPLNDRLLALLESEVFQTELAQYNIEFNLAPHKLVGTVFREMEEELITSFGHARRRAGELGANVAMIGILPTLADFDVTLQSMSANPRYRLLNDQILEARGEDFVVDIEGPDHLRIEAPSIMMEAAATSTQLHLQVSPDGFASTWNAAQAIAGPQVATAANSPFFLGKELWRETRVAVFEQSIDTRPEELTAQGVRPRVWFGERWITSILDLFDENVRYFPALLPLLDDEDPEAVLGRGDVPSLKELVLHNGTIYRWNRPVYDVQRGKPHVRVENRTLPAGPTIVDTIANAAFWYGLVRAVATLDEPITRAMSFALASDNFASASRDGIDAMLFWPGVGEVPATELVLRTLLPLAHHGLDLWEVDRRDRDHYLGIIEQRCLRRRNGASWQVAAYHELARGGGDRETALRDMTLAYLDAMATNEPVHTWPLPGRGR
jgi:gamma-glutamylcysteine synthetase